MVSSSTNNDIKKTFEPLQILGVFWILFGIVVLCATFFVQETPQVPAIRGIVTNLIAGGLLLAVGLGSYLKGKSNQRRKEQGL